jgi:hypothetical protein
MKSLMKAVQQDSIDSANTYKSKVYCYNNIDLLTLTKIRKT